SVDQGKTMAAVTSPETSPQPRVYFQTVASGSTEEPEIPVRKQGRVTVKYDRKELRKRLNLEEWIIDQLTALYNCEYTGWRERKTDSRLEREDCRLAGEREKTVDWLERERDCRLAGERKRDCRLAGERERERRL
uniref:Protein phosphatase 1, regulatory (inhibitor) subunit 14Bb n=1 Tax=Salmo trutta TaxID=8032 RepID=A0A674B3B4_SALTR